MTTRTRKAAEPKSIPESKTAGLTAPKTRRRRKTDPDRVLHTQRVGEVINYRMLGLSNRAIAERMQLATSTIHAMLLEGMADAVSEEDSALVRAEYVGRCEWAMLKAAPAAAQGDTRAIEAYLRAAERIARAYGVYDATRTTEVDAAAQSARALEQMAEAAAKQVQGVEDRLRAAGFGDEAIGRVLLALSQTV